MKSIVKRILVAAVILTMAMGLSACGAREYTQLEQNKMQQAVNVTQQIIMPFMLDFYNSDSYYDNMQQYDVHELEYMYETTYASYGLTADGSALKNGMRTFNEGKAELGELTNADSYSYDVKIDGDRIIVYVDLIGSATDKKGKLRTAQAEIIYDNDIMMKLEGCVLNVNHGTGEMMERAALDTLIGMGTVFIVLIIVCFIIWALGAIPKLQAKKAKQRETATAGAESAEKPLIDMSALGAGTSVADASVGADEEIAAVIAAALAAATSETGAARNGLYVRSIIRQ